MLCFFLVNVHGSLRNRQKSIAPPIAAARTKVLFSISFTVGEIVLVLILHRLM
jgi:hypothetical protein